MGVLRLASGAYTARVRHHGSAGLRVSLGRFPTEQKALEAVDRYEKTGDLPDLGRPRYQGVYQERAGWFYEFEGDMFGPFRDELTAAWHRRRDRDNVTQRKRRARCGRRAFRVVSEVGDAAHVLSNVKTRSMTRPQDALATSEARVSEEENDIDAPMTYRPIFSIAPSDLECKAQDENLLIESHLTLAHTQGGGW